jgi:HK97 family phage prohead protease
MVIHVITGPPCAGKSTYVREHAARGDVRVDLDLIAQALGSDSPHDAPDEVRAATFAARSAVVGRALAGAAKADHWVIHTNPTDEQLAAYEAAGAEMVELDPGIDECLRRAAEDGRPERTYDAIRAWYAGQKGASVRKTKDFRIEVKDAGEGDGGEHTFEGYAATFDRVPDSYGDVIAKGAFADTLKAYEDEGRRIPLLFGHNMGDPDYSLGYVDAAEDERGLRVTGHIFSDSPKGETVYRMLKRGLADRMSFAYDVLEDGQVTLDDGIKAHELRRLDLFECSIVTVPANQAAQITEVKGGETIAKECRRNSKADEESLATLRDLIAQALDVAGGLIGDAGDDGDGGDGEGDEGGDGANGGEPEERQGDAKALADVATRYARFIQ